MNTNDGLKLSDVPRLMERGGPKELLGARSALLTAAEEIIETCSRSVRGMTPDEQRSFDEYGAQIRDITADLAEYKRQRQAQNDSGLPLHFPF